MLCFKVRQNNKQKSYSYIFILFTLFLYDFPAKAQCNDPFPPSLTCNGAQVVCDLDGYCSTSGTLNDQDAPASFCGNIENNQWIAFVAGSANLELLLFVTNCSNNNGLQAQIFSTNDCINFTPISNCYNPAFVTNGTLTANGLTVGQTYYLMIDGWAAAVCDYAIIVMNGSTGVSPNAVATGPLELCPGQTALLDGSGSSSGANINYQWTTNDGNIVSGGVTLTPTIDAPGTYILSVTNALYNCSEQDTLTINPAMPPSVMATVNDSLSCTNSTLQLNGNGSATGNMISYNWTTSDGNITMGGNTLTPTIDESGMYTLTVTNNSTGCTAAASVSVTANFAIPDANATGGTLTCATSTISLNGSSTTPGVSFDWTGPGGFASNLPNPDVNQTGNYVLTVTAPNGCTNVATAIVDEDITSPNIAATGGTIDCNNSSVQLMGSSTTSNVTYSWTGPNNFMTTEQNPVVSSIGNYTLIIIASNGCIADTMVTVIENIQMPSVTATGGSIDCTINSVQLTGNSSTSGVIYSWTGPNNFSSSEQNPTVTIAGTYTLTVTAPNGCTNSATAEVLDDSVLPNVAATGGTIDCNNSSIQLMGSSTTPNVTFDWTGPNGFSSSEQNPTVVAAGTYTLTVTAPNGCTNSTTAEVLDDSVLPNVTATGGTIDCNNSSIQLMGSSTTPNVTFDWTGPNGFSSSEQNPTVVAAGTYTLTVTAPNGCTNSATAEVLDDSVFPNVTATGGTIDCNNSSIQLMGSSTTPNVTFDWTGPNSFSSSEQNPTVAAAGTYTLIVTAPNGCTNSATTEVLDDSVFPNVTATGGTLGCNMNNLQINGNSTTPNVTYNWTGPGGFVSTNQNPIVSEPGTYILTVIAPNGCSASASAVVNSDANAPDITAIGGSLTCNNNTVQLMGNSTTPNVTYSWTGPNGFNSNLQNPIVSLEGLYTLSVVAPNGCMATANASVNLELQPDISAQGDTITCSQALAQLQSSSMTPNVTYSWTGPNGFNSNLQNPLTDFTGTYTIIITDSNGCSASTMVDVVSNQTLPDINTVGGNLTCTTTTVQLTGNSMTPDVIFGWTGPNGFNSNEQNPNVNEVGDYVLTVTAPNGCTIQSTAIVLGDITIPDISVVGDTLTCTDNEAMLTGNSTTSNVVYEWTGPNGFNSNNQNPITNQAGLYTLVVTAPNGCTSMANTTIETDENLPNASATGGTIDCDNPSIILLGNTDTNNAIFEWTGPNNFTSNDQNPMVSVPGVYNLSVIAPNGCVATATTVVSLNSQFPVIVANGGTLTCTDSIIQLSGNSNVSGTVFSWTGPNGFTSTEQNPLIDLSGTYVLMGTAPNGCVATDTVLVMNDTSIPEIDAVGGILNCNVPSLQIQGMTNTNGLTFTWTGPNSFISTEQNPVVTEAGEYQVVATHSNGCSDTAIAVVEEDFSMPQFQTESSVITCNQDTVNIGVDFENGNYEWTGPNGFTSTEQNPLTTTAGAYTVTVTASNGCTAAASVNVTADLIEPNLTAEGGSIDCNNAEIELIANSTTQNINYLWEGPGGFISEIANPSVNQVGNYEITVTAENGCTTSTLVLVENNGDLPDVEATGGTQTCNNASIQLMGNSMTTNVTFVWEGPDNFNSNLQNPVVNISGNYTLTVINQAGCSATANTVINPPVLPQATAIGNELNCLNDTVTIFGISDTPNSTFEWTGPNGFNADLQNPEIAIAGNYELVVVAPNGCTGNTLIEITADNIPPEATAFGDTLTCTSGTAQLMGNSITTGVTYEWFGQNGTFYTDQQNPTVEEAGSYNLVVTAPNGCTTMVTTEVEVDEFTPTISVIGGTLTCLAPDIQLESITTDPNLNFAWMGPNNFTSDEQNPLVTEAGDYQVTVTAPNGCTALASTLVEPATIPDIIAIGGVIGCNGNTVLGGNSSAENPSFLWSGPNNFNSNNPNPTVLEEGNYTLVVTAENGCANSQDVVVILDNTPPNIMATAPVITCEQTTVLLNGQSTTPQVTYFWSNANGFSSNLSNPEVSEAGIYTLTITAPNDCTSSATINVEEDTTPPEIMAQGGELTCLAEAVQLLGNSTTPNVSYAWSDGSSFASILANPIVQNEGEYSLTITAPNGCTATSIAIVSSNTILPTVEAGETQHVDCENREIDLFGDFTAPSGNASTQWFTFDGSISGNPQSITTQVDREGTYFFEVVDEQNGCFALDSVVITQDPDMIIFADFSTLPTCPGTNSGSIILEEVIGGVSPFLMSVGGGTLEQTNQVDSLFYGQFLVRIEDAVGCQYDTYLNISEAEGIDLDLGDDLFLQYGDSIQLNPQINTPPDNITNIEWSNPNFLNCTDCLRPWASPPATMAYGLTITNEEGCTATDEILIQVSERFPVYVPNAFSPNGDDNNDTFLVFGGQQIAEIKTMRIFDRWGALMFENNNLQPNDPNQGWDGTFNGQLMNSGVYIYFAEVVFQEGTTKVFKGDVTLIR